MSLQNNMSDPASREKHTAARPLDETFTLRVAADRHAPALRDSRHALSYAQLDAWSDAVAIEIERAGVAPGERVLIALPRSAAAICAILGAVKAGAVYVPVDLSHPLERLRYIAQDCEARAVLVGSEDALPDLSIPRVMLSEPSLDDASAERPGSGHAADDIVYMIYTSGTTGQPKGVPIRHRGVHGLLFGNDYYRAAPGDRFLQTASLAFDASVFEIWGALLNGAELVIFEDPIPTAETLGQAIGENDIDTLWLTPSVFGPIIERDPTIFAGVSQLVLGGEPLSVADVRKLYEAVPDIVIVNGYGPTENSDFTCCYRVPRLLPAEMTRIPVGYPVGGDRLLLLDEAGCQVRDGEIGMLHVDGDRLMPGYHNRPDLSEAAFREHPDHPGRRIFRTGDMARRLADGTYDIVGRRDDLVKINGVRVETGEIDATLESHPSIRQAATVTDANGISATRLAAFIVADETLPAEPDLRRFLGRSLPRGFVPAEFHRIDSLPLTANGKLDRRALRARIRKAPIRQGAALKPDRQKEKAPGSMREIVAGIWGDLLGVSCTDETQTFFELGGTSLQLPVVQEKIREATGMRVPLTLFFERPELGAIAEALATRQASGDSRTT